MPLRPWTLWILWISWICWTFWISVSFPSPLSLDFGKMSGPLWYGLITCSCAFVANSLQDSSEKCCGTPEPATNMWQEHFPSSLMGNCSLPCKLGPYGLQRQTAVVVWALIMLFPFGVTHSIVDFDRFHAFCYVFHVPQNDFEPSCVCRIQTNFAFGRCSPYCTKRQGNLQMRCQLEFDQTLGYPGEGPVAKKNFSIITANVGTFMNHTAWRTWGDSAICLQETRIGRNNLRTATFAAQEQGYKLFPGRLLPGIICSSGVKRLAYGGTAILAPSEIAVPFTPEEDSTNLYQKLVDSKRVVATWIQCSTRTKILLFSIYAQTAASANTKILETNDAIFADVLEVCAQFGNIPCIIAGDLQLPPLQYPSLSNALNTLGWEDPIAEVNDYGEVVRPLTYSSDGSFPESAEGCSSIDAVLLNHVAFAALDSIELVGTTSQHRPIRATFQWDRIYQIGHKLIKPAALDLSCVQAKLQVDNDALENIADQLWIEKFSAQDLPTTQDKWDAANQHCLETLLQAGAAWTEGNATRGEQPVFREAKISPGQTFTGCPKAKGLERHYKTLGRLQELITRSQRLARSHEDDHINRTLYGKCRWALFELQYAQVWPRFAKPDTNQLRCAFTWLKQVIQAKEEKRKQFRIAAWKKRIKTSSEDSFRYVFHHLRNKSVSEPPNLVSDQDGHIIYNPQAAIREIKSQWDTVFGVNAAHVDPVEMLRIVWPYIKDHYCEVTLPPITAHDLATQVRRRKAEAAPGLDGWRTCEMQILPDTCFKIFADILNQVEQTEAELPQVLTTAKQVLLNKNGESAPMQKRLITILPIVLVSYTGLRFRQLQDWQRSVMPEIIQGGVKGRFMSDVFSSIRLDVDRARATDEHVVGIKIDKSKCFDRLIPQQVAALFIAFGLPQTITNGFLKIYKGLRRFLSYKAWCSPRHTTAANGVAQGCSLSLIAINVVTKVWAHLILNIPHIQAKAFIDDAYLWVRIMYIHSLEKAWQITEFWDGISGQKLNGAKSTLWATDTTSRNTAMQTFPGIPLKLEVEVLGVVIYTSDRPSCSYPLDRTMRIVGDVKNIAALPLSRSVKARLIGTKPIPRCTYGSGVSRMPQAEVQKIQNEVATTLWDGRPHWRSRWLVLGFLGQPHRIEPTLARATVAVTDFLRFVNRDPANFQKVLDVARLSQLPKFSLTNQIYDACATLGLQFHKDSLSLSFKGSPPICVNLLTPSCMRPLLKRLAIQCCYEWANSKTRKDFQRPTGLLDFDLTFRFLSYHKNQFVGEIPVSAYFDSVTVGCTLTLDRIKAAGKQQTDQCRLCGKARETLEHLLTDCKWVQDKHGTYPGHEFGANFKTLGLFEHPYGLARHRLQITPLEARQHRPFFADASPVQRWTDGSLQWPKHFWLKSAAFAVIDEKGGVIEAKPVVHWHLTSFTVELFAVIRAIQLTDAPCTVYTDNKAVADGFAALTTGASFSGWAHSDWWQVLWHEWKSRVQLCEHAINVVWIPAHCYDHLPLDVITEDMAKARLTTTQHIRNNRIADLTSKKIACENAAIDPKDELMLQNAILKHQIKLVDINITLSALAVEEKAQDEPQEIDPCTFYPKWAWGANESNYRWKPKIPMQLHYEHSKFYDEAFWLVALNFLRDCKWKKTLKATLSYAEVAITFLSRMKAKHMLDTHATSLWDVIRAIKKIILYLMQCDNVSVLPGSHDPWGNRSCGRMFPTGTITDASLYMTDPELTLVAKAIDIGGGKNSDTWSFFIVDLFE